jgi:selenocysteine lyase/cysteine desulfurase
VLAYGIAGVLTVRCAGVAKGQCVRVSPALYSTEADIDRFVEALAIVSRTRAR